MITRAPRISKKKQDQLLKCFILDTPASKAAYYFKKMEDGTIKKITGHVDVSRPTANHYYRHFREIIYAASRRAPRFIGDVEMDQSVFGGMGSKHLRAHLAQLRKTLPYREYQAHAKIARAEHKVNVFGILCRGGNIYVQIIEHADKRTLMPIIRLVVEEGSTVYTDLWEGFADLGIDGYTHHKINHSLEYMNQQGHHANTIESFWSFAKGRLNKFKGVARTTLPLHLKECEWRWNQEDVGSALKSLLRDHHRNQHPKRARTPRRLSRLSRRKSPKDNGPASPLPSKS
jgi:transposase